MTSTPFDPGPFADDVRAISAHYGIPPADVGAAAPQGQVNLTVFLGAELVLRIPRRPESAALLAKEAAVIPLVQDAGVPTSGLVAYDATLRIAAVPYIIVERVRGATLAERWEDGALRTRALGSLGEVLAALHGIRRGHLGPIDEIPEPYDFSPSEVLERLLEAGEIGSAQGDWLAARFDLLRRGGPSSADPVLVHRDVIPSNVMVDADGRVAGLLDWGLAQWGSPARDLVGLPLRVLPDLTSAYRDALRETAPGSDPEDDLPLERDALWFHLYLALARLLKQPSTSEDRNWAAPRTASLVDLLAFASDVRTEPWAGLLRRS